MTRPRKRHAGGRPALVEGEVAETTSLRLRAVDRERLGHLAARLECSLSDAMRVALGIAHDRPDWVIKAALANVRVGS